MSSAEGQQTTATEKQTPQAPLGIRLPEAGGWHAVDADTAMKAFGVSPDTGLSPKEVESRLRWEVRTN